MTARAATGRKPSHALVEMYTQPIKIMIKQPISAWGALHRLQEQKMDLETQSEKIQQNEQLPNVGRATEQQRGRIPTFNARGTVWLGPGATERTSLTRQNIQLLQNSGCRWQLRDEAKCYEAAAELNTSVCNSFSISCWCSSHEWAVCFLCKTEAWTSNWYDTDNIK